MIDSTVKLWLERFRGLQDFVLDSGIDCYGETDTRQVSAHDPNAIAVSLRLSFFKKSKVYKSEEVTYRNWDSSKSINDKEWDDFCKKIRDMVSADLEEYKKKDAPDDIHD